MAARRSELLAAVSELPLRYAPFFGRLSALWDLSEEDVTAVLTRAKDPSAWRPTLVPGLTQLAVVGGRLTEGAEVRLARFPPWFRFPRHRHLGREAAFVLEGSYRDSLGIRVAAGDLQMMEPGTEHGFAITGGVPCVATTVEYGREFSNGVLRAIERVWGRAAG